MDGARNLSDVVEMCDQLVRQEVGESHQETNALSDSNYTLGFCVQYLLQHQYYSQPFLLPWWQQLAWGVVFGAMVIMAVCGNAIVIWAILAHRRMRTVTNYFLLNLAVADLLMALFNVIFNFVFMLQSHWPFGAPYCTFSNFVANLTVASSVFTISAISVDRYVAIVRPLSPRISKTQSAVVIATIWLCAALLALPTLLYSSIESYVYGDGSIRTLCYLHWPDGRMGESLMDYVYNIVILLTTYVLPLLFMGFTYSWMGHVLWKSKGIGEDLGRQKIVVKSKQRVARMLSVLAVLFAICWLPYHIYFLYTYHYKDVIQTAYVQHVFLAIYWLAMSNTVYNPLVYYWMNARFRGYFQAVICCCKNRATLSSQQQKTVMAAMRNLWGSVFSRRGTRTRLTFISRTHCEDNVVDSPPLADTAI